MRGESGMSGWGAFDKRDARGAGDVRPIVSRVPHDPLVGKAASHSPIIGAYGGYRKTLSFGYVCLIYHATTLFCKRNYDYKNDYAGNPFWSCCNYPNCHGTRKWEG